MFSEEDTMSRWLSREPELRSLLKRPHGWYEGKRGGGVPPVLRAHSEEGFQYMLNSYLHWPMR